MLTDRPDGSTADSSHHILSLGARALLSSISLSSPLNRHSIDFRKCVPQCLFLPRSPVAPSVAASHRKHIAVHRDPHKKSLNNSLAKSDRDVDFLVTV
jgi:hypothetical protein